MNSLRTIRKVVIQPVTTKTKSILLMLRSFRIATSIITSTSWGKAWKISEIRTIIISAVLPK